MLSFQYFLGPQAKETFIFFNASPLPYLLGWKQQKSSAVVCRFGPPDIHELQWISESPPLRATGLAIRDVREFYCVLVWKKEGNWIHHSAGAGLTGKREKNGSTIAFFFLSADWTEEEPQSQKQNPTNQVRPKKEHKQCMGSSLQWESISGLPFC